MSVNREMNFKIKMFAITLSSKVASSRNLILSLQYVSLSFENYHPCFFLVGADNVAARKKNALPILFEKSIFRFSCISHSNPPKKHSLSTTRIDGIALQI